MIHYLKVPLISELNLDAIETVLADAQLRFKKIPEVVKWSELHGASKVQTAVKNFEKKRSSTAQSILTDNKDNAWSKSSILILTRILNRYPDFVKMVSSTLSASGIVASDVGLIANDLENGEIAISDLSSAQSILSTCTLMWFTLNYNKRNRTSAFVLQAILVRELGLDATTVPSFENLFSSDRMNGINPLIGVDNEWVQVDPKRKDLSATLRIGPFQSHQGWLSEALRAFGLSSSDLPLNSLLTTPYWIQMWIHEGYWLRNLNQLSGYLNHYDLISLRSSLNTNKFTRVGETYYSSFWGDQPELIKVRAPLDVDGVLERVGITIGKYFKSVGHFAAYDPYAMFTLGPNQLPSNSGSHFPLLQLKRADATETITNILTHVLEGTKDFPSSLSAKKQETIMDMILQQMLDVYYPSVGSVIASKYQSTPPTVEDDRTVPLFFNYENLF